MAERPEVSALVSAVVAYQDAAEGLKRAAEAIGPEMMALEYLLATMIDIRDGTDAANEAKALLGEIAHDLMPSRDLTIMPYGEFSQNSGWTRKWHRDELLDALVRKAQEDRLADPETGEVEDPTSALYRLFKECVSIGYGRVKALQKVGLDPGEFSKWEPGRRGVSLPRMKPE